jgi:poly(hydroxyalkanoate) granule-associated protein
VTFIYPAQQAAQLGQIPSGKQSSGGRKTASKRSKRRQARRGTEATVQGKLLNALHQVWLAGLGAAARAQRGTPKLFDELVAEGARFQTSKQELAEKAVRRMVGDARARLKGTLGEAQGRASEALENLEKIFQSRVQQALVQLGIPSADALAALSKRVDVLNSNIDKLTKQRITTSRTRAVNLREKAAAHVAP